MEQAEARETVKAVATDLGEVADVLPVQPDQVEAKARILDRLSEELAEAASMLRRSAPGGSAQLRNYPPAQAALTTRIHHGWLLERAASRPSANPAPRR
jgi:predicted phage gp36 major capsid-like protein